MRNLLVIFVAIAAGLLCASSLWAAESARLIAGVDPKPTATPPPLRVRRSLELTRTDTPPRLDGRLDDACWQTAAATGDLRVKAGGKYQRAFPKKTSLRVTYDDMNLYLAFECFDPDIKNLLATLTARDDKYWTEDDIEIMIDANYDRQGFCQFLFNAAGGRGDYRCWVEGARFPADAKYNPEWRLKTKVHEDRWVAEVALPYRIFGLAGVPPDGSRWGFNFCRIENPGSTLGNWTRAINHRDPRLFGDLKFGRAPYELGDVDLGARSRGVNLLRATVQNNTKTPRLLGVSALIASDGEFVGRSSATTVTPAGGHATLFLNYRVPPEGANAKVTLDMLDPQWRQAIVRREYELTPAPILSARMDSVEYFESDRLVRVHTETHVGGVTAATGVLKVALLAKGGETPLSENSVSPVPLGDNLLRLNVGGLKSGAYVVHLKVTEASGLTLAEKRLEFSRSKSLMDF